MVVVVLPHRGLVVVVVVLPQGGLKERKKEKEKRKKKRENGLPMVEKSSLLMEELHNLDTISPSNEST